jgi:hypothetical protein
LLSGAGKRPPAMLICNADNISLGIGKILSRPSGASQSWSLDVHIVHFLKSKGAFFG